mmetsp:Transcript_28825/g.77644  ORF Transcript_28825/g.77644 Transcript_28825/m.77644 type:complete len:89 (+) Transcript_28825:586-852(+)
MLKRGQGSSRRRARLWPQLQQADQLQALKVMMIGCSAQLVLEASLFEYMGTGCSSLMFCACVHSRFYQAAPWQAFQPFGKLFYCKVGE